MELHYFCYGRTYKNGYFCSLPSDPVWPYEHLIENKLPPLGYLNFDELESQLVVGIDDFIEYAGWDDIAYTKFIEKFKIKNPLIFMRKEKDYIEHFYLDLHNHSAITLYLNQLIVIENFYNRFKYNFKDLIYDVTKTPLPTTCKNLLQQKTQADALQKLTQSYNNQSSGMRNLEVLLCDDKLIELTVKESICLRLLAKGFSARAIGEKLSISQRTVETHIKHIKIKTNLSTSNELVSLYWLTRGIADTLL